MERLVERLEKAVERLETVCQGPGMCGDGSSKGKAQSISLAAASLWSPCAEASDISSSCCRAGSAHAGRVKGC